MYHNLRRALYINFSILLFKLQYIIVILLIIRRVLPRLVWDCTVYMVLLAYTSFMGGLMIISCCVSTEHILTVRNTNNMSFLQ